MHAYIHTRTHALARSHTHTHTRILDEAGGVDSPDTQDPAHHALSLYRRALAARPDHVPTMCNLALTLASGATGPAGRREGTDLLERACALRPSHAGAVCQLARLLQVCGGGWVEGRGYAACTLAE